MSNVNFDQPANVLWHARMPSQGTVDYGDSRHFGSVRSAIRYVMEEIPANVRGTAWIAFDGGSLQIDEIESSYKRLY